MTLPPSLPGRHADAASLPRGQTEVLLRGVPVLCVVVAGLLLLAPATGADFAGYLDWGRAAVSGDIFRLGGDVLSPLGVPQTQWSPGSGLLFALGKLVVDPFASPRHDGYGAHVVGWLAALAFWWAMLGVLQWAARGAALLALFGAAAGFVGTHAGYYSLAHGSETFADALVALLALRVVDEREWRAFGYLVAGMTAALLVVVRSHLAIYAAPALLVIGGPLVRGPETRSWRARIGRVALLLGPIVVGIAQVGVVNRWMTGSLFDSPYVFGGAGFQSLDLRHPEILAVLVHPWHGLLVYHPLYAVGGAALLRTMWRDEHRPMRLACAGILTLLAFHLYVQAAYYTWWHGTNTLGARGLSVASVLLVPALIRTIADERRETWRLAWIALTLAACLWSYPLLCSGWSPLYAPTQQFYSYSDLWVGQLERLRRLSQPAAAFLHGVGLAAAWSILRPTKAPTPWSDRLLLIGTRLLAGLILGYVLVRLTAYPRPVFLSGVALVLLGGVAGWWGRVGASPRDTSGGRRAERLVAWGTCAAFAGTTALFVNLAVRTERHIASGLPPPRAFRYASSVPLEDAQDSYREYQRVPGFATKKEALRRFLENQGITP